MPPKFSFMLVFVNYIVYGLNMNGELTTIIAISLSRSHDILIHFYAIFGLYKHIRSVY